tara:strand:- start:1077 stop:1319 length:243 start_codon:yes stop_codon:yes gene_type:complete
MKDEVVIARIPRNVNEEIVVRTATTWNINVIDIRWYKNGHPTQKGVRLNEDEFPHLLQALNTITRRNENANINTRDESQD